MTIENRVIVALDFPAPQPALDFVSRVSPELCRLKVGKELFTRSGPQFVEQLVKRHYDVFLDLKYHDIPNTVAAATSAACDLGVWMLNVHALGGREMMQAAREALARSSRQPLLIAVTILTSMNEAALKEVGLNGTPQQHVLHLADLAQQAGLDGVVCSALEATPLRNQCGADFRLVTPGIRPAGAAAGDQKRVMTPAAAIASGADYLVIGRPITQAENPPAVLEAIYNELGQPA